MQGIKFKNVPRIAAENVFEINLLGVVPVLKVSFCFVAELPRSS